MRSEHDVVPVHLTWHMSRLDSAKGATDPEVPRVQFMPALVLMLVGGAIADEYDRRSVKPGFPSTPTLDF